MQTPEDASRAAHAMELNNQGVKLLQAKRYGEAVNVFSNVLAIVKSLLRGSESEDIEMTEPSAPFCQFLQSQCLPTSADNELFLFQCPLIVNPQPAWTVTFDDLVRLSTISLYNLALSYHLGALEAQDRTKLFRKALAFYELAHKLQTPEDSDLGVQLTMAIVNNIGHIHGVLGNQAKVTQCFEYMLSTIMYLTDCGHGSGIPQLEGFVQNVQNAVLKRPTAPAA